METVVVIRNYQSSDEAECKRIIHEAAMSTVKPAFWAALTRELSLHLVVATAATMFVFLNFSPSACLLSVPLSAVIIYLVVYIAHYFKARVMAHDMLNISENYMTTDYRAFWVAEAFLPLQFSDQGSKQMRIVRGNDGRFFQESAPHYSRLLIGTAAVIESNSDFNAARMRRMAVIPGWQRHGIASALIDEVVCFCQSKGFEYIELVTSEYHSGARELYKKKGFQLRQLYHKQILSYIVQILMYEFTLSLK